MALDPKYIHKQAELLRDTRAFWQKWEDNLIDDKFSSMVFFVMAASLHLASIIPSMAWAVTCADLMMVVAGLYFWWLCTRDRSLDFKLPMGCKFKKDKSNEGGGRSGKPEGIMYLGNLDKTNQEIWFTNSDVRTHILYLGTTGSGKTEGLKSIASNAMCWGSGFIYVDGKADTDLWSSLSSLVRRFGRDDDLLVLNYMTGNSSAHAPSNTMNPFSSGSAGYLVNMLVSLMPDGGGDNAMWKERAVALIGAVMPALTWKRDFQDMPLSIRTIREYLALPKVIKLARDEAVPKELRSGVDGYLNTLPGYVAAAFDNEGKPNPPAAGQPAFDITTASQQHGYLAMQFTRALQSLGDDYGYIFDTQAADVDMVDVVLNRRVLVVLIPALEKSNEEIANLGKIVAATIKGMMGSTLGATIEGVSAAVIENKPTHASTPFVTIFDEVGYYTAEGMAVMAAQARSLGFCLVFSGQDLPAMKKRVKEEANSIVANCNIKIFGKLEDPTETKEFFEKTVGESYVIEASGYEIKGSGSRSYMDTKKAGIQKRANATYSGLRNFKEGQVVITFGDRVRDGKFFYSNPGKAKAMRVGRYVALPEPDESFTKHAGAITKFRDLMVSKSWTAVRADVAVETEREIVGLRRGLKIARVGKLNGVDTGIMALVGLHALDNAIEITSLPAAPPPTRADVPAAPQFASPLASAREASVVAAPASSTAMVKPLPATILPPEIEAILVDAASKTRSSLIGEG